MVSFVNKKIDDDGGLPQLLRDIRSQAHLSIEKISKLTLAPEKYLIALEEGRYWDLPGEVYGRQFLKAYAKCLSINPELLLEKFEQEYAVHKNWQTRSAKVKNEAPARVTSFVIGPWFLKRALVLVIVLSFFTYIGWEVKRIVDSPTLVVDSPTDNLVTSRQVVEIKGWVEPESRLFINGQEVYSDQKGNFNENLGLQPGVNLITFSARKKYSKEKVLVRKVMVKNESPISQANN